MTVDTPTREHFRPTYDEYTQFVCVGPKFLASGFATDLSNREERRKKRFAEKLVELIGNGEIPFTRIVVNDHTVDEAATRLKKKHRHADAVSCVNTVLESEVVEVRSLSYDEFEAACDTFVEFDDHDGAMTDFLNKVFVEEAELSHVATWDGHYRAFDDLNLLPNCEHP